MGNLSGESREQNRKDRVTRFRSVTYVRQLGLLVNTQGSHLKQQQATCTKRSRDQCFLETMSWNFADAKN